MVDLEIRYPSELDILPVTTTVTVNIGSTLNAFRDAILNLETILGLDVNIGLFTPDPESATVADRLNRIERGIAERNLVFREINVSDALQVQLNQNNEPFVNIGLGSTTTIAPVTIKGPLTVLSPAQSNPRTIIQTPVSIDVTTYNENMSANSLIKGKANALQPILRVHDTSDGYSGTALHVIGNMKVEGTLETEYSIDHNTLLNIDAVPTDATRGTTRHVSQGDFHSHRKGRFDEDRGTWIVDSSTSTNDFGIISHRDLQGWGTLPTHDNSFTPDPNIRYHVTGGDLHAHKAGDGAQIDHTDLKSISPKFSNHVTGGDSHRHTSSGDGGKVSHLDLDDTNTTGANAVHVTSGDAHAHQLDSDGNPLGDGAQIDHAHLLNTSPATSNHVTGGDNHTHSDGDGGQIDHENLSNKGSLTHSEIDASINTFRATTTGTASFTASAFNEIEITHSLGTDQFNVAWSLSGVNVAPPSSSSDVGVIYVGEKNSTSFKLKRIGGSIPGPAVAAQLTTDFASADQNIQFIARNPGAAGNNISIEYESETTGDPILTETSPGGKPIFIEATSNPPTFTLHFDAGDKPTAADARAALLNNSLIATFLTADLVGDGSGLIDAYGASNLAGGSDVSSFSSMEIEWIAVATT